jgi:N-acetyl-alpha-D-glucosaminyl L-malate synthase BshA
MNIGIVCYPTYGGSGVLATELGMALAKRGHQVHFITYRWPARLSSFQENIFFHEVTSHDYPLFEISPYESSLASKLVDVVKHAQLDVLHIHYAVPHAAVAYLAKQILLAQNINIPYVTTLHGTDITLVGIDRSFAPVVQFSIEQSDIVTAVSESLKRDTLSAFSIKKEIKVIYNFVDFERFKKSDKDHFRKAIAPEGEAILLHTSNFRVVKRVKDVIDIFKKVHESIPSKLLLIGDGPQRAEMESLCRKYEICNDVRFLGKQDAVAELLAIADIFLLPSEKESFGLSALEAMACEVPVISSDAGGLTEVNIDGETGFVCSIGDVEAMAEKSLYLLSNPDVLQQFRKNALKQAKKYSLENILPQYEKTYEEAIKNKSLSPSV